MLPMTLPVWSVAPAERQSTHGRSSGLDQGVALRRDGNVSPAVNSPWTETPAPAVRSMSPWCRSFVLGLEVRIRPDRNVTIRLKFDGSRGFQFAVAAGRRRRRRPAAALRETSRFARMVMYPPLPTPRACRDVRIPAGLDDDSVPGHKGIALENGIVDGPGPSGLPRARINGLVLRDELVSHWVTAFHRRFHLRLVSDVFRPLIHDVMRVVTSW